MNLRAACLLLSSTGVPAAWGADRAVAIRFRAQVGDRAFACGQEYEGIGVIKSKIRGRDFRFYVSNVRLLARLSQKGAGFLTLRASCLTATHFPY